MKEYANKIFNQYITCNNNILIYIAIIEITITINAMVIHSRPLNLV